MVKPLLEEVFKLNGVPTFTFVEPKEYTHLFLSLRTPGRGVVVEGPSGIGKTTAVETALRELGKLDGLTKLSARRPTDIRRIEAIPGSGPLGIVMIDDFHKLNKEPRAALADYMKVLADEESEHTKLIIIGINKAGENLIAFAPDLTNRIDVIPFESTSEEKISLLIRRGLEALNVGINVIDEIVEASYGSFYLAQMLCQAFCRAAGILERSEILKEISISFEMIRADVWEENGRRFRKPCERFCRGPRLRKEGRAPYLHILRWLSEEPQWTLSLRDAVRRHTEMRGSVGRIIDKEYLKALIEEDEDLVLPNLMHYSASAEQLSVEDPLFMFYIRNIPWRQFAQDIGFAGVEFSNRYDFALSFAGEDREMVELLFNKLAEAQVEIFYDKNEQHRMLADDIEEYLRPIYQTEALLVIVFLSAAYPKKIWTKFESDQFKERFKGKRVIPVWFSDAPAGMFDESRRVAGFSVDRTEPPEEQIAQLAELLLRKLREERVAV